MINLFFPLLHKLDAWLLVFPLVVRVVIHGLLCGVCAMALYRLLSNQRAIARLKAEARELRSSMLRIDQDPSVYAQAMRRNLAVAFALLGRALPPALLAAVPTLIVSCWLAAFHGYALPESGAVPIQVDPPLRDFVIQPAIMAAPGQALALTADRSTAVVLYAAGQRVYQGRPFNPPVTTLAKRGWWNAVLETVNGYLAPDAPIREIRLRLSRKRLVPGLPDFLAGWETPFFLGLFVAALGLKFALRIE